jgi:hypothetical protein
MKQIWGPLFLLASSAAMVACGGESATAELVSAPGRLQSDSSLRLTVAVTGEVALGSARVDIEPVACSEGEAVDAANYGKTVPFTGMSTGAREELGRRRLADYFTVLPAGCYRVGITPLTAAGEPASGCTAGGVERVEILDGQTAELMLVAQCQGDPRGALDVATLINTSPEIVSIEYLPGKYVYECERVTICAAGVDRDGDGVQFEWQQVGGEALYQAPEVVDHRVEGNQTIECVATAAAAVGRYELGVRAFDVNGAGERIENVLPEARLDSHDTFVIPLYAEPDIDEQCVDASSGALQRGAGARPVEWAPDCVAPGPKGHFCSQADATACPAGEFDPRLAFPICS